MLNNRSFVKKFFAIKVFGIVLGVFVFVLFSSIGKFAKIQDQLEIQIMDLHFSIKRSLLRHSDQENVVTEQRSHKISQDIILLGIDSRTLDLLGRWPFPRSYHADLLNSLTRIQEQNTRESAILLDILFNEVSNRAFEDVALIQAIKENGRVALQTQIFGQSLESLRANEFNTRLHTLIDNHGEVQNIQGDISKVTAYYGIESPLIPYADAIASYGHASYKEDYDKVYRRQQLIVRYSEKIGELKLKDLQVGTDFGVGKYGHLGWVDSQSVIRPEQIPLTERSLQKLINELGNDGVPRINNEGESEWYVSIYRDRYIPAISLSLALQYFNRTLEEIEVEYGSHIRIPHPMHWNPDSNSWEPYRISVGFQGQKTRLAEEIRIPIDENGNMLINFMGPRSSSERGGYQTFPLRSYSAYALDTRGSDPETWPKTKRLGGKIMMVGAFSFGMADDEKPTPLGLMFGVEVHANAVNTIIMDNFIHQPASWVNASILFISILFFAVITSRMRSLGWSMAILLVFLIASFLAVTMLFEYQDLWLNWATPALAVLSTFVIIVIYRVLTAERDKKQIKDVFGQFISPAVVDDLTEVPPELGGEDVNVTVFFSDIRGFSRISERLSAQELVKLLNDYLTDMTNSLVNDFDGTLDKYIGDAIMAFWGAPRLQENHAVLACKSAIMQIRLLEQLNKRLENESPGNEQTLQIGIGLNSGNCMVGYMGSEGRKNYTAMGDTVNLASRLEGVTKTYQTQIIISEDTWKQINNEPFIVRELDEIRVKGRLKPVTIYELLDYDGELLPNESL